MQKIRNKALIFLLPAYILVLIAAFIPHHHHISGKFCTDRTEEQDLFHVMDVDCIDPNCEMNHDCDKDHGCDDSSCIAKVVYLAAHAIDGKGHGGLHPLMVPIQANNCELEHHEHLFGSSLSTLLHVPDTEVLHSRFLASSCGLRAPPTIA